MKILAYSGSSGMSGEVPFLKHLKPGCVWPKGTLLHLIWTHKRGTWATQLPVWFAQGTWSSGGVMSTVVAHWWHTTLAHTLYVLIVCVEDTTLHSVYLIFAPAPQKVHAHRWVSNRHLKRFTQFMQFLWKRLLCLFRIRTLLLDIH